MDCEPSHFRPVAVLASDHKSGRLRRCAVLILIAAFFLLPLVGCKHASRQSMSSLWGPQGRRLETRTDSGIPPQTEPSVSANSGASVATQQSDSSDPADPNKATTAEPVATRSTSSLQTIAGALAATRPIFTDRDANAADVPSAEFGQQEITPAASIIDEGGQEQLERLEAALDRDAEQAAGVRRLAGSTHDVRVRVDALLEKSRRLFDLGQLREARHAAKVAHDLGDSARLDYAPDEERPIDLVLRIDDRIKEASELGESQTPIESLAKDSLPTESATANANAATSVSNAPTSSKATPAVKSGDGESPNKPRKGWTQSLNVFGGGRKPTTPTPAATQPSSTPSAAPEAPAVQLALDTHTAAPEVNDGAVVQANRSLTLATAPRTAKPESIPDRSGDTDSSISEFEPHAESTESSVEAAAFAVNQPDLASDLRSWPTESVAAKTPHIDEPAPTSADLIDVEPLPPFRDMAGPAPTRTDDADAPHECRSSDYGWPIGIALFVGCSLVAVFWYRRGAV